MNIQKSFEKSNDKPPIDLNQQMQGKVPGLFYCENLLSDNESKHIVNELDKLEWTPIGNSGRCVQQYGYYFDYKSYEKDDGTQNFVFKKAPDFPDFIIKLRDILTAKCKELGLFLEKDFEFNQCIVNNYKCGEGISAHIDFYKFGSIIASFTIGEGGATMKFSLQKNNDPVELFTEIGSLYIMSSDARYKWFHQMSHNKYDIIDEIKIKRGRRISITFRYVPL
jgi:alkylated DNA repair dioxygenase AlkB